MVGTKDRIKNWLGNALRQVKELGLHGYELFRDNNMSVYSGYATLFIVTSVFPCIILIISIVNLLPGYSAGDVAEILFQILPDLGSIKDLIISLMEELQDQSGGLLASAAAVTTLWSASKGVSAIQKGLDQLDKKELESEPKNEKNSGLVATGIGIAKRLLKQLLFTLTLVILIPALLVFEMLGDSIAGAICSAIKKIDPNVSGSTLDLIDSVFNVSSLVVIVFALLVILQIFAVLPQKRRTLRSQLPGALLAGVCWFAFTELFAFFIPRFYHASSLYGSLASLFLLLLWLRYVVMILFAGGVLNRVLEENRRKDEEDRASEDAD